MKDAIFTTIEANSMVEAVSAVLSGAAVGAIVRKVLSDEECQRQAQQLSRLLIPRASDVPGGTLGPSLFEHADSLGNYFEESALAADKLKQVAGEMPAPFEDLIQGLESYGFKHRIKALEYRGRKAQMFRGLGFPSNPKDTHKIIVPPHDDLSNVLAFSEDTLRITQAEFVVAYNLYLKNQPGFGSVKLFNKRFSQEEKKAIDESLELTGFPYPEEALTDVDTHVVDVEEGDFFMFRADYPHSVFNNQDSEPKDDLRLSLNGFFTSVDSPSGMDLVFWT